jgi:two-component system, cell cycle response regulator
MRSSSILVIDDSPTALELTTYLLNAAGFRTLAAEDGPEGIELARTERPDLVLCDIHLPAMDGFEIARAFRADPALANIPMIAVTASAMVGDREKILAAGFRGYIAKPVTPEMIGEEVSTYLTDLTDKHE